MILGYKYRGKRMYRNKKQYLKKHFMQRSVERVGVFLEPNEIIKQIQNNKLEFIERKSNRVTLWKYYYKDTAYKVIYDKQRKELVTIIPMDENN